MSRSPHETRHNLPEHDEETTSDGPFMLNLQPSTWANRQAVCCQPILENAARVPVDVPLVAYGHDLPTTFAYRLRGDETRNLATMHQLAMPFLQSIEPEIVAINDNNFLLVHNHDYAAEKIVDKFFMKQLSHRLGDPAMLLASVPCKGRLLVTPMSSGAGPMAQLAGIAGVSQKMFDDASLGGRLSTTVFTVVDGKIVGLAQPKGVGEPVDVPIQPRSWWQRLMGM